jgi:glycine cleavage system regulatory protein
VKPILVLGPERPGEPTLERQCVNLHRTALAEAAVANAAAYSTVIVINDGDAETIRRLVQALEMRRSEKRLCIGVLTYLDDATCDAPHEHAPAAIANLGTPLRVDLKEEVISFEYQAG